jgi:hypothetical protein
MDLPRFLEWSATPEGEWWMERLRIKWRIQAVAERQQHADAEAAQEDAAAARDGWRGGRCDPSEVCDFDDGGAEAA